MNAGGLSNLTLQLPRAEFHRDPYCTLFDWHSNWWAYCLNPAIFFNCFTHIGFLNVTWIYQCHKMCSEKWKFQICSMFFQIYDWHTINENIIQIHRGVFHFVALWGTNFNTEVMIVKNFFKIFLLLLLLKWQRSENRFQRVMKYGFPENTYASVQLKIIYFAKWAENSVFRKFWLCGLYWTSFHLYSSDYYKAPDNKYFISVFVHSRVGSMVFEGHTLYQICTRIDII